MAKSEIKDINFIEVSFNQSQGKRDKLQIQLNETMFRGDALKVAHAIRLNQDVSDVKCFTLTGAFI